MTFYPALWIDLLCKKPLDADPVCNLTPLAFSQPGLSTQPKYQIFIPNGSIVERFLLSLYWSLDLLHSLALCPPSLHNLGLSISTRFSNLDWCSSRSENGTLAMTTTATMPGSASSSSTNGVLIFPIEATAVDDHPVSPFCEVSSSIEQAANEGQLISSPLLPLIDAKLFPPPQISGPKKQRKSRVSRLLWPAVKSASNIKPFKEHAAAEPPSSLFEAKNVDDTNARQALAPGLPNSSSSPSKPESFALTTIPSTNGDGLSDPSAFKTPAKSDSHIVSEPPPLIRGKKRYRPHLGEMSPIARHRLGKRRMRAMI